MAHLPSNPLMVSVVSSTPTEGNAFFFLLKPFLSEFCTETSEMPDLC